MRYTFGTCEIDLDRVEIRVAGAVVPVQPQVFDVIEYLLGHRDRVVTKEELLEQVWGDRFVSESAMTSRIKSARRLLGDNGRDQSVIRTVHGRGYRFVAAVEPIVEPVKDRAAEHASGIALASAGRTLPPRSGEWPLIGRYVELEQLLGILGSDASGVLIAGPRRIGKTRLAEECLRAVAGSGLPTARVRGLTATRTIPLAALAHLISPGLFAGDGLVDDLARAALFRKAHAALEERAGNGRLVVLVDDAEFLDELTVAVLGALMAAGTIFGIVTERSAQQGRWVFDELVRSRKVRELMLGPLDETHVDVLLYRVLEGPLDLGSLRRLGELSHGRAGLLRDLVGSSLASGALARDDGVWRLVGPVTSTTAAAWPPDALGETAVRAAELIALVGSIPLDEATGFFGTEAIDELDGVRLLTLDTTASSVEVALDDPLLAETIVATISPLRVRRYKAEMLGSVMSRPTSLVNIATATLWADELGLPVDQHGALRAARRALASGLDATAESLERYLSAQPGWQANADLAVIRAELCARRGQWARAEQLFAAIDVEQLDETAAAFALRRRAEIEFHINSRQFEAVAWLREQEERAGGRVAVALARLRIALLSVLGQVNDVLEAAAPLLDGADDRTSLDVLLSVAHANALRGDWPAAIDLLDRFDRRTAASGPALAIIQETALCVRLSVLLHRGHIDEGSETLRQQALLGRRTIHGWLPSLAAAFELAGGRPRAARELIRPIVEARGPQSSPHERIVAEAYFARTSAALGLVHETEDGLRAAHLGMAALDGQDRWLVGQVIADLSWTLGRSAEPVPLLLALATEAHRAGSSCAEAQLLTLAAVGDDDPATARRVGARVAELAARFGGDFWPVCAEHVRTLADGGDLDGVVAGYDAVGHRRYAEIAVAAMSTR